MRLVSVLALILLPAAIWGQEKSTSGTGHYEGVLSVPPWGADSKSFDIHASVRRMEAKFGVSPSGFGWVYLQTTFPPTFIPWEQLTGWCSQPGTALMITSHLAPAPFPFADFKPEDLVTVIKYFKQYAPEAEVTDPQQGCSRRAFR